jgi:hypothetical protein
MCCYQRDSNAIRVSAARNLAGYGGQKLVDVLLRTIASIQSWQTVRDYIGDDSVIRLGPERRPH